MFFSSMFWLALGGLTARLVSIIMGRETQTGAVVDIVAGTVGAPVGGFLVTLLGVDVRGFRIAGSIAALLCAVIRRHLKLLRQTGQRPLTSLLFPFLLGLGSRGLVFEDGAHMRQHILDCLDHFFLHFRKATLLAHPNRDVFHQYLVALDLNGVVLELLHHRPFADLTRSRLLFDIHTDYGTNFVFVAKATVAKAAVAGIAGLYAFWRFGRRCAVPVSARPPTNRSKRGRTFRSMRANLDVRRQFPY